MPKSLILGLCAGYFLVFFDMTVVNIRPGRGTAAPRTPGFASGAGSAARNLGGAVGVAVFAVLAEADTAILMAGA
ncbi:MAG: hypothetical protein L0J17_15785 [Brevibacterium sp.]|uniref:hypothetical protein n=1 Tax=Brevibacterium sp. TaxID=1701 RepID=UPI002647D1D2|nr:hypothetical protein [Brevibacterium sp.]MDN5807728.1 hypothetical protein [Brevibacterium sp.]MDN5834959.1 hypothetical protein [Brevibacterium sp.]MDN5876822.1 hypothetical protein [Brevibacterium sp.]MDN6135548.1 hypothetical protein [Brevibacterium sp.]MDN6159419.1 hypothetical protein [Brevibacterium sp.]